MEKPANLPIKDYLLKVMSVKLNTPHDILETVINDQFESARKAVDNNNSVEFSGFGKFLFLPVKAKKKLDKHIMKRDFYSKELESGLLSEAKKISYQNKLNNTVELINYISNKLNRE